MKLKDNAKKFPVFEIILYLVMTALMASIIVPFVNIIAVSMSSNAYVISGQVGLWPKGFTLKTYEQILADGKFFRAFGATVFYTVVGTALALLFTSMGAYALSRRRMLGQKLFSLMITITMFFGGGMIPTYLAISNYGLIDSIWAVILPYTVSTWNLIVMRSFFISYPNEIIESGQLDGLSEMGIFFRLVLPTSKAVLATIGLYYAVSYWNSYMGPKLYLRTEELYPVQLLLRDMLVTPKIDGIEAEEQQVVDSIRNASIIVTVLPIMCVYPFIQKYFVKGVMVGSIKG